MGFGSKGASKSDINAATQPYNFNFGNAGGLNFNNGVASYAPGQSLQESYNIFGKTTPMVDAGLQYLNFAKTHMNKDTEILRGAQNNLAGMVSSLPTSLNINDMFNNPYAGSMQGMLTRGLDRRRNEATKNLNDELNARNQLGSSYGAYAKSLQERDFGDQYANAEDQARQYGAQAYLSNLNYGLQAIPTMQGVLSNYINQLGGIQQIGTQGLQNYFYPMQVASQVMSPLAALQGARVSGYNQLNANRGGGGGLLGSVLPLAGQLGGALIGGPGGAAVGRGLGGMTTDGLMALRG